MTDRRTSDAQLIDIASAVAEYQVSSGTFRRALRNGKLRAHRRDGRKKPIYLDRREVEQLLQIRAPTAGRGDAI